MTVKENTLRLWPYCSAGSFADSATPQGPTTLHLQSLEFSPKA